MIQDSHLYPFGPDILSYRILNQTCLFVCFKGVIGTGALPGSPLCLTDVSIFAEIPTVVNSLCTIIVVWGTK